MLWEELKKELFQDEVLKLAFDAGELKIKIIKELMLYLKKNNMTQEQFSEKIGVKQQVISRFIKGEINPRFDFVAKILILLKADIDFQEQKERNSIKAKKINFPFEKMKVQNTYRTIEEIKGA
ncbi:helix-turn-helix domain-containing protein [Fusobacterium necrophorum]|uniref:DNA-binding helix-turn-helix protein n=1 Tax=Fusobacterium necrophorum subsp. funduliforme Fnf 1007 TaxID=1161424 RepID=A0AAN4ATU1_9FUSO|nr:helix-turn-helix transcriptional regulator [Fusobacterium necrophorum]EJU18848.1 DNA-binding helix-turn-helix protein [Fusobacterium necrophorum subsp. funduliforme Fnf 1007]